MEIQKENSTNTPMTAMQSAQNAFAGEAERLGLENEQDIVDLIKEFRREVAEE